jgi:hypothetical protein
MWNWLRSMFRKAPPAPVIPNQNFSPYDAQFYQLYRRCRYNRVICEARVIAAIRTDNRANIWLLISTVGAGLAGTIKAVAHVETEPVWEVATLISVVLAIIALWKRAPEIKFTVFESIRVFDRLAMQIQRDTIRLRRQGADQEIENAYLAVYDALNEELGKLGPDHNDYENRLKRRLEKTLNRALRDEGAISP